MGVVSQDSSRDSSTASVIPTEAEVASVLCQS